MRKKLPPFRAARLPSLTAALALLCPLAPFHAYAEKPDLAALERQLSASDRIARREAAYELRQLGKAAKPALPALIKALGDDDQQVWANAIAAVAEFGPDAADAIPKLLDGMRARSARGFRDRDKAQGVFRCAHALSRIGAAAKAPLITALSDDDQMLRAGAAKALGGMGPAAKDAIPALIENLGHDSDPVRNATIEALGLIGADARDPLLKSLGSPGAKIRAASAMALGAIGRDAAPAGDAMLSRLKDEQEPAVRAAILRSLPRVGADSGKIIPPLITAFKSGDETLQTAAFDALILIRPAKSTTVPALIPLLSDARCAVRTAKLLGRIGSEAQAAAPALIKAAASTGTPPDHAFTDALAGIGAPAVPALLRQVEGIPPAELSASHWAITTLKTIGLPAIPELEKALASASAPARIVAAGSLSAFGDNARHTRPAIAKLTTDTDPAVRAIALRAITALGDGPGQSLEALDAGLGDKSPVVRIAALDAASSLRAGARPLGQRIGALLDDPDAAVRAAALKALATTAGNDRATVEKITARLDDPATRLAAIEALGKLDGATAAAAPKLAALYPQSDKPARMAILGALDPKTGADIFRAAVKDPDAGIREAALAALAPPAPVPDDIAAILNAALGDSEPAVRRAAAETAGRIGERDFDKVRDTVPPLIAMVENEGDRHTAMKALGAMRVRDPEVVLPALDSSSHEAKLWALEALGRMGGRARPQRERIEALLRGDNEYLARAARRALQRIGD